VASLAWRLHAVLGGQAHDRLLDTYATERLPHVRVFTEFSVMLGGVICVLDPAAAAGRDAYMLGPGAAAEDRYPDPPLSASSVLRGGDPQAGRLSLQARVALNGGLGRFDDLLGGGFLLLGLDHDPAAALTPEQRAFLSRLGGRTIGIASPMSTGLIARGSPSSVRVRYSCAPISMCSAPGKPRISSRRWRRAPPGRTRRHRHRCGRPPRCRA
jgi:hypothetical protein